jgi:hypothetical protein
LDKGRHALTAALAGRALRVRENLTGSIHCLDNPQSSQLQLKEVSERDVRMEEIVIAKEEMNRLKRIINIQSKPPLI